MNKSSFPLLPTVLAISIVARVQPAPSVLPKPIHAPPAPRSYRAPKSLSIDFVFSVGK